MDASLKQITGLSLRKKGAVCRNPVDSGVDWILMRVLRSVLHVFNDSNVSEYRHQLFMQDAMTGQGYNYFLVLYIFHEHVGKECNEQHVSRV